MDYITTKEAAIRFKKSISTIKRVVSVAPDSHLRYEPSKTAKNRRLFISVEYLEGKFSVARSTTTSHHQDNTTLILEKELERKQSTIDKLLDENSKIHERNSAIIKQLTENEERMQILLDRSNQRANLLEQHFDRNRKANPQPQDEIIEDIIEAKEEEQPETVQSDFIDTNDEDGFIRWLNSLNAAK